MRINQFEIDTIKSLVKKHFGDEGSVSLFGSRTDDAKRGGDIDLGIIHPRTSELTVQKKIQFQTDLIMKIGDQKIDVVLDIPATKNSAFIKTIQNTAIKL